MAGRDPDIQALRAVAALLVVCDHAMECLDRVAPGASSINRWFPRDQFGACGVDLFFVISGYVMTRAVAHAASPGAFLRARSLRVAPLAWGAGLLFLAVQLAIGWGTTAIALANTATMLPLFDPGPYHPPLPGVGWTLGFELFFYLLAAAMMRLAATRAIPVTFVLLLLLAASGALRAPVSPLLAMVTSPLLAEFALGLAIGMARPRGGWLFLVAGVLLLALGTWRGFSFRVEPWVLLTGAGTVRRLFVWGVPAALIVAGLAGQRRRLPRLLGKLGDASYALYLVHTLPNMLLPDRWTRTDTLGANWLFVTLVASSILLGLGAHRWIERPLLARLRGQASAAASASTVRPRSFTSAKPPSTWMRAATLFGAE